MGKQFDTIVSLLGDKADSLLKHECKTVDKKNLHLPGPDFIERTFAHSDRSKMVPR